MQYWNYSQSRMQNIVHASPIFYFLRNVSVGGWRGENRDEENYTHGSVLAVVVSVTVGNTSAVHNCTAAERQHASVARLLGAWNVAAAARIDVSPTVGASHTKWVLGETQSNAALVADGGAWQLAAVQFSECTSGKADVVKLHEAHWAVAIAVVVLVSERQSSETLLVGEQLSQLSLSGIRWQVTNVQRVARWVLVSRVGWRRNPRQQ